MPDGHVLEFTGVTKRFGAVTAVDGFTARVEPGVVTGFLGPNGAGKTTSLRILLGLVGASSGTATIGGRRYAQLTHPLQTVGAALEASSFHPGRSAANHLKVYAQAAGIPASRIDDALGTVGLADVAGRKVGGFSLGMRQRLGLAYTLLGDPGVLVLDEPSNGLDPEGIKWMRGFLRDLARQGRTVLVSSHQLGEIQQTAEALLIIARGRLVFQGSIGDLTEQDEYATVVDSPDRAALASALTDAGLSFDLLRTGLTVRGADTTRIGAVAAAAGVALSNLQRRGPALEEVFLDLVNGERVHPSATSVGATVGAADGSTVEREPALGRAPAEDDLEEPVSEPVPTEPADTDPAGGTAQSAAAADADVDDRDDRDEPEEDDPPLSAPTWDADQPTTDSDLEADRFFSRYDAPVDGAAPLTVEEERAEPDPEPEAHDARDDEGGEQR